MQIDFNLLKLLDLLSPALVYLFASAIILNPDYGISLIAFLSMQFKVSNFLSFLSFLFGWYIILKIFGLYHSTKFFSFQSEVVEICKATFMGTCLLIIIATVCHIQIINTLFLIIFWTGTAMMMIFSRYIISSISGKLHLAGKSLRNVVIIGTNERALNFARKIDSSPSLGYRILGFIDDSWQGNELVRNADQQIIATLDEFPTFLRNNIVDEVIIYLPLGSFYQQTAQIVRYCEEQGVTVRIYPDFFNLSIAQSKIDFFDGDAIITLGKDWAREKVMIKRVFDISVSAVLLLFLSPILVITAILIKINTPGPILFIQDRIGLQKRVFKIYKFRTMVVDAQDRQADLEELNEVSGPVFKIKKDPRITSIGKILRKTSIDELPQLLNVFKGDMSLVGPRPLPVRDYCGFDVDWHRRRFSIRPGITCLWQVSGRNNITFEKWMELDMNYIDQWSLELDFKILLATIPAVLKGSGAS